MPGRSFPSWLPHKEVFKSNVPLAWVEQNVTLQAANFAVYDVTSFAVTILYSASQLGQRKGIGFDWLIVAR